jgi:membrane protein required for colicin V production
MSLTDIILLLTGSYFIVRGMLKGFSGEVVSLVSVFGGAFCALRFRSPVSLLLSGYLGLSSAISDMVSMVGIFAAVCFACHLFDGSLKKVLATTRLTWMDKTLGTVAGFLKVYVIAMFLLVSGMLLAPVAGDAWVSESRVLTAAAKTWPVVSPLLDKFGLLPDLAEFQRDARDYILKQAERSIFGTGGEADETRDERSEAGPADKLEFLKNMTGLKKNKN